MVSSIRTFAQQIASDHVIKGHVEKRRAQTINNSVDNENDYRRAQATNPNMNSNDIYPTISAPLNPREPPALAFDLEKEPAAAAQRRQLDQHQRPRPRQRPIRDRMEKLRSVASRQPKIQLLIEEKDRFDAMRAIQRSTSQFRRYSALTMSVIACELLNLTYCQSL